jgi:hypothetical protein
MITENQVPSTTQRKRFYRLDVFVVVCDESISEEDIHKRVESSSDDVISITARPSFIPNDSPNAPYLD